MKKVAFAAAVAACLATPAFAQDNAGATFTGFRVEAIVGYDNIGISGIKNPDGVVYGIGAGYDFAAGGVVLGVEAEASDSTAKVKLVGPDLVAARDLYAGGRIGTVVGNGLLYGKVGYTNARTKVKGLGGANGDGVRAGLGYELPFGSQTFAKVEYRYSNYEAGISRNQVVAGFGVRF